MSETLSDKLAIADVVVVAKRIPAEKSGEEPERKVPYAVAEVLKDEKKLLGKQRRVVAPLIEDAPADAKYVILGAHEKDFDEVYYLSPWVVSDRAIAYLKKLPGAPPKEEGVERLAYFQEWLNDPDDLIANDAYDEIARAPFADVKALGPRMHRDKLLAWVQDRSISALRRRQYLTLLSVCGQPEDAAVLEKLVLAERGGPEGALDATAACYLTLKGEAGLPLIEKRFIKNQKATRSDGLAIAAALRFHGEEEKVIPRPRLLETLRLYLDRPEWANQVMAELARWEDWSVVDRMARLFYDAEQEVGDKAAYALRVPIVQYLKACPKPEAKKHLAELEQKYPKVVRAADIYPFLPIGSDAPAERKPTSDKKTSGDKAAPAEPKDTQPADAKPEATPSQPATNDDGAKNDEATPVNSQGAFSGDSAAYPVVLTGIYMLLAAVVVLNLLLATYFGFRPRITPSE